MREFRVHSITNFIGQPKIAGGKSEIGTQDIIKFPPIPLSSGLVLKEVLQDSGVQKHRFESCILEVMFEGSCRVKLSGAFAKLLNLVEDSSQGVSFQDRIGCVWNCGYFPIHVSQHGSLMTV
jgi:hypothetical protein